MSINTFKLDGIDAILNKHIQPWTDANQHPDSSYRERLSTTHEIPMPADLNYLLKYERHLLFSYRVRYYCRLADNAVADHLRQAFNTIDYDQSKYMAAYLLKLTREAVTTLIADAVSHCQKLTVTSDDFTDFNDHRHEKEWFVILHYVIASLVRCWMEMQQRYQYVCDESDLHDIASFYASVVGWINDPIVYVEPVTQEVGEGNKRPKIKTCSFFYINDDPEDRNTSITAFYNKLIYYQLIPEDCLDKLIKVFSGGHTNVVITWMGNPWTLKSIIKPLIDNQKIVTWPNDYSHWHVVSCRFVTPDGSPMKNLAHETDRKGDVPIIADIVSTLQ